MSDVPPPPPPSGHGSSAPDGDRYAGPRQQQPHYPQQELLPQEVKPGRSRLPLVIGLAVVLTLIAGAVVAWLLLRDDGEGTRAQYCDALEQLAPDDDLAAAVVSADASTLDQARNLADLAPGAVADDWKTLDDAVASMQSSSANVNPATLLTAYGALKNIVSDSNDHCGTAYRLPLGP